MALFITRYPRKHSGIHKPVTRPAPPPLWWIRRRYKVACKQRQLAQCVTLSGWLISCEPWEWEKDILPYFATEQLTVLIETDWDSDGAVHFTQEAVGPGGRTEVCVCVPARVCLCWGRVRMRQRFHKRRRVRKKELAEHRALISLWRYRVPGPNFGSHQGAIFSAYHSSFITVWLLCRCYLACGRQTSHNWKPP